MTEEGGTKIQRRQPPPPPQMQQPPSMQQQQPPIHQQMMQQQQPPQMMQQQPIQQQPVQSSNFSGILKKPLDAKALKYSIAVVIIFVVLNSKIVWSQLSRLPFLNTVEPSIIALIINSILAGIIFYVISMLIK